ncbi:hypothetical protein IAR55_005890 [Kwoniella newhampshirensis]|uniref:Glutamine amidotransferase type-2 domain-containing protein n=1 Tax=Kwoniella newhampshirensis TaxID=1651941 RepID=A0AAW0YH29_9TREE
MCRWFTYLGEEPQLLEDLVLRPTHSLVKQIDEHYLPPSHKSFDPLPHKLPSQSPSSLSPTSANDTGSPNPLTNMDGFGIGWWSDSYQEFDSGTSGKEGLRPVVYKNTRPPLNDLILRSLASGIATRAVVGHVRAGTGLTPVVETNCHPYTFGRHLFCHNGTLGSFHLFKPQLLLLLPIRYQLAILGTTDSEHIAALYFYHLCGEQGDWEKIYPVEEMGEAMIKTLKVLEDLKATAEKEKGGGKSEHNALNLLVSSGSSLVAIRYASPAGKEPPSLYYSTTAGAVLNRKYKGHPDEGKPGFNVSEEEGDREKEDHRKHVIVASEPSTLKADEWELIDSGAMVLVDEEMDFSMEALDL